MHTNALEITALTFLSQAISFHLTEFWSKEMTWKLMSHHWPESPTKSRKLQIRTPCCCLVCCQSVKGQILLELCCVYLHNDRKWGLFFTGEMATDKTFKNYLRIPSSTFSNCWKNVFCCVRLRNIAYFTTSCRCANSLVLIQFQNTISFSV